MSEEYDHDPECQSLRTEGADCNCTCGARWVARIEGLGKMAADRPDRRNLSPRQIVIEELEVAAVKLRDAELAWKQAGTEYRSALDRFNAVVAPLPK